jgi:arylsulfatase
MLPVGQLLWLKELESYREFPPLQAPETYNLTGIMQEMRKGMGHPSE